MATYYVRKSGNNALDGLTPATAWATIGKALGSSGMSSGDTTYVGAGVYRESVSVAMVSPTSETKLIGDVTGKYTGDAGEVRWTAYATNDTTLPVATATLILVGRDFLTFENISFVGGTTLVVEATSTTNATNITFRRCSFQQGSNINTALLDWTGTAGVGAFWTLDSCIFGYSATVKVRWTFVAHASTDFDTGVVVKNCVSIGGGNVWINIAGLTGTGKAGNAQVYGNTIYSGSSGILIAAVGSTSLPCLVTNNLFICTNGTGLNATTSGQITENYNLIYAAAPRTNVTAGANSISNGSYCPLLHVGHEWLQGNGNIARPFGMPTIGSPILGIGTSSGMPTVDVLGANRPSGGSTAYAIGAFERPSLVKEDTVTLSAGKQTWKIVGPGYYDTQQAVYVGCPAIEVKTRYDSTHGTTNKPQIQILNGGECGVADQTVTATVGVDTTETLSASVSPTANGFVTVRLISRSAAAGGIAYFSE